MAEYKPTTFNLRLDKDTFEGFQGRLRERNRRLSSLRPIMIKVGQFIRAELRRNFDTEGSHSGPKWAPNKEPYASWKRGERSGGIGGSLNPAAKDSRVMHRYLNLRNAVTILSHPDHVETVYKQGRGIVIGVQEGTQNAKVLGINRAGEGSRLPKRNVMRLRPDTGRRVAELLEDYINTGNIPGAKTL